MSLGFKILLVMYACDPESRKYVEQKIGSRENYDKYFSKVLAFPENEDLQGLTWKYYEHED